MRSFKSIAVAAPHAIVLASNDKKDRIAWCRSRFTTDRRIGRPEAVLDCLISIRSTVHELQWEIAKGFG